MKTDLNINGNKAIITLDGRLDTTAAVDFEKAIKPILNDTSINDVLVDCTALTYISSSGLRNFIVIQKGQMAINGKLVIKGLIPDIKEVFDMTGFTSIFTIID